MMSECVCVCGGGGGALFGACVYVSGLLLDNCMKKRGVMTIYKHECGGRGRSY